MKKISLFCISAVLFSVFSVPVSVSAQGLLPSTELSDDQCEALSAQSFSQVVLEIATGGFILKWEEPDRDPEEGNLILDSEGNIQYAPRQTTVKNKDDVLGCALRTGRFRLEMLPYMALYGIKFFSGLAGVLSVLFIVIGGYHFIIGSLTEEKEKGKKTVTYALIGFALSMLAYTIVNFVQIAVSS